MKHLRNLSLCSLCCAGVLAASPFACADTIDLNGAGTLSGGSYAPATSGATFSVDSITGTTFAAFSGATVTFYPFNINTLPTSTLFTVTTTSGPTETLTFTPTSQTTPATVYDTTSVIYTGELEENGSPFAEVNVSFAQNQSGSVQGSTDFLTITSPAPEPGSLLLLATGLSGVGVLARRQIGRAV